MNCKKIKDFRKHITIPIINGLSPSSHPTQVLSDIFTVEEVKKKPISKLNITWIGDTNNDLIRNILSINGVTGVFLGSDFISVNKKKSINWEDVKHIVISLINEYYQSGNKFVIDKDFDELSDFLKKREHSTSSL